MKSRILLSTAAAALLAAGIGVASAQTSSSTTTTTTWSPEHGSMIREYSTTQKTTSFKDPALQPRVGVVLPNTVELHPLPPTVTVPQSQSYSYSIINDRPVVVERSSRRIIHTWE
jgi:hypothetical protein